MTLDQAGARRVRPRNRRAMIVAAATELCYRRGYDQVGMSEIAEAVSIGPSALYRHFAGKQDLLREVLDEGFTPVREAFDGLDLLDRAGAQSRLAELALDHRQLGVLWQRESRHLAPEDRTNLRVQLRGIGRLLADRVHAARPELSTAAAELLAWSMLAVLTSISFHHLELPRAQFHQLMTDLVGTVLDTPIPDGFAPAPPAADGQRGLTQRSRREALLAKATRMFASQGYTGVGIEEIGAAVGIAGPSIYNHFPSKLDMLTIALRRGIALVFLDLKANFAAADDAADGLRRLVPNYIKFTRQHHDLVTMMITELEHLPEHEQREVKQAQLDYIAEWTHLLHGVRPGLDPTTARITVQAALSVANDAARIAVLRHNPAVPAALDTICTRLLLGPPG